MGVHRGWAAAAVMPVHRLGAVSLPLNFNLRALPSINNVGNRHH